MSTTRETKITVGQRIHDLRIKLGFSQRELATERVSYAYISRIEAGTRNPSHKALIAIANQLNVRNIALLGESDITGLYLLTGNHDALCPFCRRRP